VRLQARCRSGWDHSKYVNLELEATKEQIQQQLSWMKTEDARQLVKFPASPPEPPGALIKGADMLEFIRNRGSNPFPDSEQAIRTLSSLLTFPLSLSYGLSYLFPHTNAYGHADGPADGPTADRNKLNVLVLGARSESSLPALWWRELLSKSGTNINIRMLGPGLQQNKSLSMSNVSNVSNMSNMSKYESISVGGVEGVRSLQIENNFPALDDMKLFHDNADAMGLMLWADVFVLYNPGYGTLRLKDSWSPSLRLLLQTRKPVLCTAYGSHDLRRYILILYIVLNPTFYTVLTY
jgi:hypothetical protein